MRPHVRAGIFGMLLVVALYIADSLLLRATGQGLNILSLVSLLLPGTLAAHLCRKAAGCNPEQEGLRAGLLTAHFATLLQITVLVMGVLSVDWPAYTIQVGPTIANAVRDMAVPATVVASLAIVAVTYVGCTAASWLGTIIYTAITKHK